MGIMKHHDAATARLQWALAVSWLFTLPCHVGAQDLASVTESRSPAAGSEEATAASRTILIETLQVEGTSRESVRRIVLSESRLAAGGRYTEQEIAGAARRIKRLPFILDARPTLRRGSAPGEYGLVFVIDEHASFSLGISGGHWSDSPEIMSTAKARSSVERFLGPLTQLHLSVDTGAGRQRTLVERSWALHSEGPSLFANVILGLTRHGVIGQASRLDIDLSVGRETCTANDFLDERHLCNSGTGWGLNSRLLVPLARDSSLSLFAGYQAFRGTEPVRPIYDKDENGWPHTRALQSEEEREVRTRRARFGLAWAHDTTDDPVAALRGTQIVAGLSVWRASGASPSRIRGPLGDFDDGAVVLRFRRLFPLSQGFTVSAVAVPVQLVSAADSSRWGEVGLGLRWVQAGHRNRYRLSLESGVTGTPSGTRDRYPSLDAYYSHHWTLYSSLRFRSGLFAVALDARWAR
jgi:hypothetical protein